MAEHPYLCYNCFRERDTREGPCPHCGFDLQENEKKYPVALRAGTVLEGRYIIGRVLGQGGFGITYLALDTQLNAKVAIKEFMPSDIATRVEGTTVSVLAESKTEAFGYGAERFQEEARTLAKFIGNPNIAGVSSYFDENGTSYFVMDYIEGISFKTYIANHGGKVSVEDALNVMIPVLRALTAVHQEGFIHRDVTPDNIYITKDGMVKLLDFGSARYSIGDKSKSLDVILKVGYAPKEQYIRRSRQGPYTDVYSCAACFYAAITGFLPPESLERLDQDELVPISKLGIEIPEYLDKAILKGLAVQPEDRFQSAAEFLDAIESQQVVAVPGQTPPAPASGLDRLVEKMKKKPLLFGGIAAAALVVLVLLSTLTGGGGGGGGRDDGPPLRQSAVDSIRINGQEYSTNERELKLDGMGLTDADVEDLKYMINLTYLNLRGNDITDLSFLTDMTGLRELELGDGNNGIVDLSPLAGLTDLRWVGLPPQSQISDLTPLANLTKLESVYFSGSWGNSQGMITDLSPLAGLTELTELGLTVGHITDLSPLSGLTKLQDLQLYGDLSGLDGTALSALSGMTSLTDLNLNTYDSNGFPAKDLSALSGLTKLQTLRIDVNGLESLKGLENAANLTELQIYGSHNIQDLSALGNLTKLQNLQISGSGSGNLKSLKGMENLSSLREMRLYVDGLESLEGLQGCTSLTSLEINGENYTFTDLSPLASLTKLQNLRIQSYGNTSAVYLEDLSGLKGMSELKELNLNVDGLNSLGGLEGLTSLTTCYISGEGSITSLEPLRNLIKLQELSINCYTNSSGEPQPVDASPLSGLANLQTLSLSVDISSFEGLKNLTKLQTLSVSTQGLTSLTGLEDLTGLRELSISGTDAAYTDVDPLANLTNLQILRLPNLDSERDIAVDISGLAGLTNLQDLDLYGKVQSLAPLSGLTNLKTLDYTANYNYEETGVSLAPLSSLTGLTELYLSCNVPNNDITPLSNLTQLRSLRLYIGNWRNPVQSLEPLRNLTSLTDLTVGNTADGIDTSPVSFVPSLDIY